MVLLFLTISPRILPMTSGTHKTVSIEHISVIAVCTNNFFFIGHKDTAVNNLPVLYGKNELGGHYTQKT